MLIKKAFTIISYIVPSKTEAETANSPIRSRRMQATTVYEGKTQRDKPRGSDARSITPGRTRGASLAVRKNAPLQRHASSNDNSAEGRRGQRRTVLAMASLIT